MAQAMTESWWSVECMVLANLCSTLVICTRAAGKMAAGMAPEQCSLGALLCWICPPWRSESVRTPCGTVSNGRRTRCPGRGSLSTSTISPAPQQRAVARHHGAACTKQRHACHLRPATPHHREEGHIASSFQALEPRHHGTLGSRPILSFGRCAGTACTYRSL